MWKAEKEFQNGESREDMSKEEEEGEELSRLPEKQKLAH